PHFAISIALEQDGDIVAGVVFDPIKDEMFWAEKGVGAYLNDHRLRVSGRRRLSEALLATGMPFAGHGDRARYLTQVDAAMAATAGVRRWGAAALDLAYVAAGRFDGFWEEGLSAWDVAAGALIIEEAGGRISKYRGEPLDIYSPPVMASNGLIHEEMMQVLTS